jgi:hypothetical protein
MIDLRKLLLSQEGMTLDDSLALERYVEPEQLSQALQERVREGLLREQEGHYSPTERGTDVLCRLTDAQKEGITDLWHGMEQELREAAALAGKAIAGAADAVRALDYPAFTAERAGFLPDPITPAYLLWSHLGTLRYLRGDAHALAWREHGLDAVQVGVITALWKSEGRHKARDRAAQTALATLTTRGWVEEGDGRPRLTAEGREHRDQIEWKTNLYATPPLEVLTEKERATFVTAVKKLPSGRFFSSLR